MAVAWSWIEASRPPRGALRHLLPLPPVSGMGVVYNKRLAWDLDTKRIPRMRKGSKKDHNPRISW